MNGAQCTIKSELTNKHSFFKVAIPKLAIFRCNGKRDGEVKRCAGLFQIRWCKVHGHARAWKLEFRVLHRTAHAFFRFLHGRIRQSDNDKMP